MAKLWPRSTPARVGVVVLVLLILPLIGLAVIDCIPLAKPLAHLASGDLHRQVQIEAVETHLLRWHPSVRVDGLRIANPEWAAGGDTLDVDSITIAIVPWRLLTGRLVLSQLQIEHPQVSLLRDESNRATWDFGSDQKKPKPSQPPGSATHIPAVNSFTMQGGVLKVDDKIKKLTFDGSVDANEAEEPNATEPFQVHGHGTLNGKSFELTFGGSSLFNLRLDEPYEYNAKIEAGPLQASAKGAIDKPFDLAHLGASIDFKGENLASLYYLTGLALPFTPPFHLSGELRRDDMTFVLKKLQGTVGNSDLHGDMRIDASRARPRLTANLISHALDLADLAPSVGAGVPDTHSPESDTSAPKTQASDKLLPDYKFEFDRLRSMDAAVELRAESVKTQKIPIQAVDLKLVLDNGILTLDPADLTLPEGKFSGAVRVNAQGAIADTHIDARLSNVRLDQFKGKKATDAPLEGELLSRAQLEGHGNSVHDILTSSNGIIVAVIPHGEMRQAFAEFTGINAARGLGLLLTGSKKEDGIRCGIAVFKVDDGKAQAQPLVFDLDTVVITGSGGFDFNTEALNLRLHGQSKKLDLIHVRAPIVLGGTLGKPSFGLDAKSLAAQGGAAAVLGAVATPVAAIAAFIDPGFGKNQDCAALLSSPAEKSAEHPGPPQLSSR